MQADRAMVIWWAYVCIMTACGGTPPKGGSDRSTTGEIARASHAVSTVDPSPNRPPLNQQQQAAIAKLVRATERVRQLKFRHPVAVEVHSGTQISKHLASQIEPDELQEAQLLYSALGLIDADLDLQALVQSVLREEVVGYYDPKTKKLVVRDDVMLPVGTTQTQFSQEAAVVLVHELVHALQDQQLGLGDAYEATRDTDAEHAFRSVVEGDATLAMIAFLVDRVGGSLGAMTQLDAALHGLLERGSDLGGGLAGSNGALARAPKILQVALVAPYLNGAKMCATLYRSGGWAAIDAAHEARLPRSTEQVLHAEKYRRNERPLEIDLNRWLSWRPPNMTHVDDDTLGELEMSVYFGRATNTRIDRKSATGWNGDRVRLYRDGRDQGAVIWFSAWDSVSDAEEAYAAALRADPAPGANKRVRRVGRALLITRGLTPPTPHIDKGFEAFARSL